MKLFRREMLACCASEGAKKTSGARQQSARFSVALERKVVKSTREGGGDVDTLADSAEDDSAEDGTAEDDSAEDGTARQVGLGMAVALYALREERWDGRTMLRGGCG
jgi:hypothetical protein